MSLLCSSVIKADDIKIKGKKVIKVCTKLPDEAFVDEVQTHLQEELDEKVLKVEEEINLKLEQAQIEYEQIINSAQEESERIIEESNKGASNIEKKAYEEGYSQGVLNGYEDGYKEAYEDNIEKAKLEASEILENASKVLFEAKDEVALYMKENKKNIVNLAVSICEQVLREKFEDTSSLNNLVISTIDEYELRENFVIKVNPMYKESLDAEILSLKENHKLNGDVFVLGDESIEMGNAVIETIKGKLVVGIDSVLSKVKEELL